MKASQETTAGQLRRNPMMNHLMEALEQEQDIGQYGRLVFTMVARHFLPEEEIVDYLAKNPGIGDHEAKALLLQVKARGYNPPRREKILEWQRQQEFPICPGGEDRDSCNLYRDLQFPEDVYENITSYYQEKAESE